MLNSPFLLYTNPEKTLHGRHKGFINMFSRVILIPCFSYEVFSYHFKIAIFLPVFTSFSYH